MRVVSYSPPIEEATKTIRNPNDPDDPGHLELVEGRPGSAVLEGPFEIEVILPEDCDFEKVRNSVGSKVMIDTRYWVTSKTETDLQGRTIQSNEANMGVFMPTARQTLCNWEGKPLPTIKQSSPKDKVVEDTGEADRDETGQTGDAERAN
jgi:hypothetical protein